MTSTALYARVSSSQQAQQATIGSQLEALRERVRADGHTLLPQDEYIDDGYSGATLERPALERLRDRMAEGRLERLYVHSPDRLARQYAYQVLLLDECARHGVDVLFLNRPSAQTAEDHLLVQVQGMIAEYERAKILERSRRGKKHRAKSGLVNPLSGAPYGYQYVSKADQQPAEYRVLLHEARVVKSIFSWFVEEQLSIGAIVRKLQEQEIATRTGKTKWDRTTIWGMLRNPAYMGRAAFGKTKSVPRGQLLRPLRGRCRAPRHSKSSSRALPRDQWTEIPVPALVSPEVFDAASQQLSRNQRLSKRNGRGERYLLQGLTLCGKCGYAYYGKTVSRSAAKGGERYGYYRCTGTDGYRFEGGRLCDNDQVRVDQLDGYVWDEVSKLLADPERVLTEWSVRSEQDSTVGSLRELRDEAMTHLQVQQRALQRLLDAYEAGLLELSELKDRSERVRVRLHNAQEQLGKAELALLQTVELHEVVASVSMFAAQVQTRLTDADWPMRQRLIRTLVARVEIDEEGATVVYRAPGPRGGSTPATGTDGSDDGEGSSESCRLRLGSHDRALGRPFLR